LERAFGTALAARGVAWVTTSTGIPWKLDLSRVEHRWIVYGDYEGSRQMGWIRRWLVGGGIVVDSGASVGEMLLYIAPMPDVRVLAVEPMAASRAWLAENLAVNPGFRVTILDCGLGERPGVSLMQSAGPWSTMSLDWYAQRAHPRLSVRIERLDGLLRARDIPQVRLWKLDVEGSEAAALRGASGYLEAGAIDAILVEVAPPRFGGIRDCLAAFGYQLFEIASRGRLRPVTRHDRFGNLVALSPSRERGGRAGLPRHVQIHAGGSPRSPSSHS
jgi:FkbM family methyltransferase